MFYGIHTHYKRLELPSSWWEHLLHNQTALRLKAALLFHPGVVVANVPYHMGGHKLAAWTSQSSTFAPLNRDPHP